MRELLLEIWASVRRNKLRTFLTGFSVAWGIFMLVILLGSGRGLQNGAKSNLGSYATNSMDIYGGWTKKPYMGYDKGRSIQLYNSDLEILKNEFPEVEDIAANMRLDGSTASYENSFTKVSLRGALPKIEHIQGVEMLLGRFINDADIQTYRKTVVIDQSAQTILFKGADPLGKEIRIGNSTYTIVGVYKGDKRFISALCYIPLTTGQLIYRSNKPEIDNAVITIRNVETDEQIKDLEKRIVRRLAAEHHFDPTDESAIWIHNTMEMYKNFSIVFWSLDIFIWIIGLGTLFAGVVGVSNIMLVTVTERTFEFGIRKALGAKPSSIIRLILTESVIITALFGYMGMVLGVAVMEGVNYVLTHQPADPTAEGFSPTIFLNPTLDLGIAVSATLVLVIAGLIAGYVPAYRAARLKTIDALRHNK